MRNYFNKHKHGLFPEIKDWKDAQNEIRFRTDYNKMPMKYWLFFTPLCYHLVLFSISICAIIFFGIVPWLLPVNMFIRWLLTGLAILQIPGLITKIKQYKLTKNMNFYDLWMRED